VTDLGQFVGRFHPLLVHLPIGFLLFAAVLSAIAGRRAAAARAAGADERAGDGVRALHEAIGIALAAGAAGAVVAATAGLLLGASGGYGGAVFEWHERLGVSIALMATLTAATWYLGAPGALDAGRARPWRRASAILLTVTVALLLVGGHLGATLTHGEGYLTEHAPAFVRRLLGAGTARPAAAVRPEQVQIYASLVEPILREHCVACHGADRAEGRLRLDTADGIRKGGEDGVAIVPGRAASSELIRRAWLPTSDKHAMPPPGRQALRPSDAAILRWWVDQGAPFQARVADVAIPADVRPILEAVLGPISQGGPSLPSVTLPPPDPRAIEAAEGQGLSVVRLPDGTNFIEVHATNAGAACTDRTLALLQPLARHIVWLDLGGTAVTDAGLAILGEMPNLTRLHLNRTQAGDATAARIATLSQLEYLNLYGTQVSDAGLARLAGLKRLRSLYVWQSRVTPAGVERLHASLPRLSVDTGSGAEGAASSGGVPAPGAR
jgi:uncharacterized membrane protein